MGGKHLAHRRGRSLLAVSALVAGTLAGQVAAPMIASAGSTVGSFEIDGNRVDNSGAGEPLDWASLPAGSISTFTDPGPGDTGFTNGSSEEQPGGWQCGPASAPQKGDILGGEIAFRTLGGKQYAYLDFTRKAQTGDVHIDYEFNKAAPPATASCSTIPHRSNGDIVLAFDGNGGVLTPHLYSWTYNPGSTTQGTFTSIGAGVQGSTWDGITSGTFGEAALDLTDTIGTLSCGQFSGAYMKSRSSESITSSMQDYTSTQPIAVGSCPKSNLTKGVRNVTAGATTFSTTTNASPGDVLEYQLTYSNTGAATATNVAISDTVEARQTYLSCSTCTTNGPPVTAVSWTLASVPATTSQSVTFQVTLDAAFPAGATAIHNTGSAKAKEDASSTSSNSTETTVRSAASTTRAKTVSPNPASVGQTVTYTITYTNTGTSPDTVSPVDNYDQAHLTITAGSISNGGVDNGDTITWSNLAVPAKGTLVLTYSGVVKGTYSGLPGNDCTTGQYPVVNSVTDSQGSFTKTLCVTAAPSTTRVKSVTPNPATVGQTVNYTITYTNTGDAPDTVSPVDDYDQTHISVSNASITNGGVNSNPAGVITWSSLTVPAKGTLVLSYSGTVIGSFSGTPGTDCSTGQYPVLNTVTDKIGTFSKTLCVTAAPSTTRVKNVTPNPANVGQTVSYSITYTNAGDVAEVFSPVDDYDQTHIAITAGSISNGGVNSNGTITWSNLTVPAKGSLTLTYTGTVIGTFSGTPGTGCTSGQYPVSNTVTDSKGTFGKTLCVNAAPSTTRVKSVSPNPASVGQTVSYSITYTNAGDAADTVSPVDDYDQAHIAITAGSISNGGTSNGDKITWTGLTVPAKGSLTLTYTGTVIGTFSGTPGSGCSPGQYPVSNTVTDSLGTFGKTLCVTAAPSTTRVKSVTPNPASVGQTVSYSITYTNTGDASDTVSPVDDYDQTHIAITAGSISNGGVNNATNGTITWSNLTVPAKGSLTLTYSGTVIGTFSGTPGTGCSPGQYPVSNTVTDAKGTFGKTLCVTAAPSTTRTKVASPNPASVGQVVTYTITYTNTGDASDTVSLVDDYDQTHVTVSDSTVTNGGVDNNDTITWTNLTVPAKGTLTLSYQVVVIGTFSGTPGSGCTNGNYPVLNSVTDAAGTFGATLCVHAVPNTTRTKTASPNPADIGQLVTYTITYTNTGDAADTVSPVDDYDQAHIAITAGSISNGGTSNGDKITWTGLTVPAKGSLTLTYSGTVGGTFSGAPGGAPCSSLQYPVQNQVTDAQGTFGATLCVNAGPILTISKTACPASSVVPGGLLTYTITFGNSGTSAATGVVVVDTIPAGTTVADAGGGTPNAAGTTVTYNVGTLAAGASASRTLTLLVGAGNGATVTNNVSISAANAGASVSALPVSTPVSNTGAITHGSAYGVDTTVLGLSVLHNLGAVSTVAPGSPPSAFRSVPLPPLTLPGVVSLSLVTQTSNSVVDSSARSQSTSTVTDLDLLSGLIHADVVRGVSSSTASGSTASSNSLGSTFANLKINGNSITNVAPNASAIPVYNLLGIQVASVKLYEETKSASFVGGKFTTADSVNMIHVTILKSLLGLSKGAEIIIGHVQTDAAYPSGLACGATPGTVSGEAYTLNATGTFAGSDLTSAREGDAVITPLGGSDSDVVNTPTLFPAATALTTNNTTSGSTSPQPTSTARSRVEGANVLGGLVTADVLDVQSNSTTTATSAGSTMSATFANLRILGAPVNLPVAPNTVLVVALPGGLLTAVITLNEQILNTDGLKNTAATVNAIHVRVFAASGLVTADVVVASAHSDAHHA